MTYTIWMRNHKPDHVVELQLAVRSPPLLAMSSNEGISSETISKSAVRSAPLPLPESMPMLRQHWNVYSVTTSSASLPSGASSPLQ